MRIVSLMWGDPAGYVEQVHDANGVVLKSGLDPHVRFNQVRRAMVILTAPSTLPRY
jgi:hypothetical protein